jgi:hypothetical protein
MFCGHCSLEEEKNRLSVIAKQGTEKLIDDDSMSRGAGLPELVPVRFQ